MGDIRFLALTKQLLPKLSYYYLGLSAFLFGLAAALPFVWAQFLWYFAMFFGYIIQASVTGGLVTWLMALLLYAVIITVFVVLVTMAKSRFFGHQTETVSV